MKKDLCLCRDTTVVSPFFATEAEVYAYAAQHGYADRCHHLFNGYSIRCIPAIDIDAIYRRHGCCGECVDHPCPAKRAVKNV